MKNWTDYELGWIVGFLEGEGSFQCHTSARVSASQVQFEPIEKLVEIAGGKYALNQPTRKNEQPCFRWELNVEDSMEVMRRTYLLMSPKRREQIKDSMEKQLAKRYKRPNNSQFCVNGHELTEANTYLYRRPGLPEHAKGVRYCRICTSKRLKKYNHTPKGRGELIVAVPVSLEETGL